MEYYMSDNEKNINQSEENQSQEYIEYEVKYEDTPPKMKIIDDKVYDRRDPLAPKKLIVVVFDEKGNELIAGAVRVHPGDAVGPR